MRPVAFAAATTLVIAALACGGGDFAPAPDGAVTGPTVFFVQIDT